MKELETAVKEQPCGHDHFTIEDALRHARLNLTGDGSKLTKPFWGTRGGLIANVGRVIGYQSDDGRKRYRLDYAPGKGVHVNEEDFNRPVNQQKQVHLVKTQVSPLDPIALEAWRRIQEGHMQLFWNKWTSRYDKPPAILEAEQEVDRQRRGS